MKNSARRKLLACLQSAEAIPSKAQAAQAVLICASGEIVNVYTFEKIPYFFDTGDGNIYPTVYFAWISPTSFATLLVPEQVLSFLENGADLMLPGVIRRQGSFPEFRKHYPVTISVVTKDGTIKGPVAVGVSLLSSMEMLASGMQGRGVKVLQLYRDFLWDFGPRCHPPSVSSDIRVNAPLTEEDFPALGALSVAQKETDETSKEPVRTLKQAAEALRTEENELTEVPIEEKVADEEVKRDEEGTEKDVSESSENLESPENLLLRCFLAALKFRLSKIGLPLDLGEFYLKHLLACVPPGRRIDMKKTKYKKFTVFLKEVNAMEGSPVLKLDDKKKGAEVIIEINYSHPLLKNFERTDEVIEGTRTVAKPQTKVEEFYALTEPVVPIFRSVADIAKGDLISASEARRLITAYVKMRELNEKSGKVSLNDVNLSSVIKHDEETIKWDVLMQKILSKMTKTFIITTLDGMVLKYKLKLPEITFKVETRSGNKKVTLLNNVAAFGIEAKPLCQKIQVGVATSATIVNDAPQCEGPQIVVQGNQVRFLSNLLMEEFGIDKKHMSGLDLAPKKKK